MDQPPGIDQIIGGLWQPALIHITGFNLNERFVLAVDRVKMRRRMLAVIEANDYRKNGKLQAFLARAGILPVISR